MGKQRKALGYMKKVKFEPKGQMMTVKWFKKTMPKTIRGRVRWFLNQKREYEEHDEFFFLEDAKVYMKHSSTKDCVSEFYYQQREKEVQYEIQRMIYLRMVPNFLKKASESNAICPTHMNKELWKRVKKGFKAELGDNFQQSKRRNTKLCDGYSTEENIEKIYFKAPFFPKLYNTEYPLKKYQNPFGDIIRCSLQKLVLSRDSFSGKITIGLDYETWALNEKSEWVLI